MTASSTSKRSGVMRYSPSLRNFRKISSGGISGSLAACVFFAGLLSALTSGILLLRLSLNTKRREFLFHEFGNPPSTFARSFEHESEAEICLYRRAADQMDGRSQHPLSAY